jgi:tetratricopeptide (TPR) repeat protein
MNAKIFVFKEFFMAEMDVAAYLKRVEESFDKEDYDQAISDLTEVIRLDPDNAEAKSNLYIAQFNLGIKHFQEGDIDHAIADLTEAIRLDPNDAAAYSARGIMYSQMENPDGAIDDLTEAIRLDPADIRSYAIRSGAYHDKSIEYRLKGDTNNFFKYLDLCIKDHEVALEIKPDDAHTQEMLKLATKERESWKAVAGGLKTMEDLSR